MVTGDFKIYKSTNEKCLQMRANSEECVHKNSTSINNDLEKGIFGNELENEINKARDGLAPTGKVDKKNKSKWFRKIRLSNTENVFLTLYTIVGYFFTSIAIIYYNHWLFDKVAPFPVFATWIQQIVGMCCFGIASLSRKTPNISKMGNGQSRRSSGNNVNGRSENEGTRGNVTSTNYTSNENISAKEMETGSDRSVPIEIAFQSANFQDGNSEQVEGVPNQPQNDINTKKMSFLYSNSQVRKLIRILPMSICFVGLVAFGNICLKYVQVSTYQLARSGSLIFTVIVSYLMLGQKQTWQSILACVVVCAGFLIGSLDRSSLSTMGIITGLASSFCQVFYNVFMKKCMNHFDGDAVQLMKYNQFISTLLLIPCIFLAQELNLVLNSAVFDINQSEFFRIWVLLIVCGLLSMLLNYFTFLVVGYTSPVTFNVLGMFKSCAQTAGGFIIFHDHASVHSVTGICLTLAGSVWYGFAKSLNCKSKNRSVPQSETNSQQSIILGKNEFEHNGSILAKELKEVEELGYSAYINNYNKTANIPNSELSMGSINSCLGVEMPSLISTEKGCECNSNQKMVHENQVYKDSSSDCKIIESPSLTSCISDEKNEDRIEGSIKFSRNSEQKELERLFEKFTNISIEGSTELRSSVSKISVSLPASVYASPAPESRQISIGIVPNGVNETSNENISLDVSILVESEREVACLNEDRESMEQNYEESDEEKSTIIATIY
ncbi:Triose-phosphate Transporter family protein [Cryptosporidium felis]|nr:Triose-phosphate Transporter family protein [Cryptosporidium felis]